MSRHRRVPFALVALCLVAAVSLPVGPAFGSIPAGITGVAADGETVPVGTSGDSADDPAIWVDETDPSRSIVIGNDKGDALEVYDLAGTLLQRISEAHGNVDVRYAFPLDGGTVDIAAATRGGLRVYRINPTTRTLTSITDGSSIPTNSGEGLCLYRSATSGRFYAFQITRAGALQQWWLRDADADGLVDGQLVRSFDVGSEAEGCVADDDLGHLYISEEDVGIWKYGAEPGAGTTRTLVDSVTSGHLVSDVEGLAIVRQPAGTGLLLASAQNVADPTASYFTAYQRDGANTYAGAFRITSGAAADGCSRTDGIEAVANGLGAAFPSGMFVCQDDANTTPGSTGNQNFKLVRLEKILAGLDLGAPPGPDTTPPETTITGGPSGPVTSSSATLAFSASEAGSTFACSLDGAAPTPCTSPVTYPGLALGDHHFEVAATDAAGNTDPTPAARTWTLVEPAPGPVTLLPTDDARVAQASPDTNYGASTLLLADRSPVLHSFLRFEVATDLTVTSARLRLFATDPTSNGPEVYSSDPDWNEATITWNNRPTRTPGVVADVGSVRSGRYVEWDVSSVVTGPGVHSFELVPESSNGADFNSSEASTNRPELLLDLAAPPGPDTTPPETSITDGPTGTVSSTSTSFSFVASEPGSTFACSLDGAAPTPCTSPVTYPGLALGDHHFEVAATDAAGNTDPTPAVRTWTLVEPAPGPVTLLPTDDARVAQASPDTNYGASTLLLADRSPVLHSFLRFEVATDLTVTSARLRLFATDPTSNGPEVYSSDPDWNEGSITWNNRPTRTPGVVADVGSVRSGRYVEWDVSSVVTGPGVHSFELVPESSNGADFNSSEASTNRPELLLDLAAPPGPDTTPPETSITDGPTGTVSSTSTSFSFVASEPGSTFACSLDAGPVTDCTSPAAYSGLSDGLHHFEVTATDTAGNVDATPASRSWTVDTTTPPAPTLDTISTLAGTGSRGFSGDGGPATAAQLSAPRTTATDSAGNTYVTDTENHRIRRISTEGTITTVAGTGSAGYGGDDGPATAARLNNPHGVDVDAAGNLYIADSANHRIRRISPSGTITTVAGTGSTTYNGDGIPATQASLAYPKGVTVAPDGSLYVGDANHHRVRRFVPGGTISTVAGTGTAGYSGDGGPATAAGLRAPRNIAFGPDGSFFIADNSNYAVRRVSPAGVMTTVAGTGVAGYSGDGGPATSARLGEVRDVAVDAAGNIYIADQQNHRIRRVSTSGIITTFAGIGTSGFSGDGGAPQAARVSGPRGVEVTPAGDVLIADTGNHRIRRVH